MADNYQEQKSRHVSGESSKSTASTDSASMYVPTPPDGGWGWVIVTVSFLCNMIVDGIAYSYGVFLLTFLDYFKEGKAKTSLVGSLLAGVYLAVGPIVSALTNRYGCRAVTIAGAVFASAAFVLSTLSPNVDVLILTFGVLGGIGFGMMYLPSIVSVGYYFEKKRALATGIAVCGSGCGTFLFAPFVGYLLETYDWKNAMYIIAGIVLQGAVCGALMRPLEAKPAKKRRNRKPRAKNVIDRIKEHARHRTESENSNYMSNASIMNRVQEAKEMRQQRIREEIGSVSDVMGTSYMSRMTDSYHEGQNADSVPDTPNMSIPKTVIEGQVLAGSPNSEPTSPDDQQPEECGGREAPVGLKRSAPIPIPGQKHVKDFESPARTVDGERTPLTSPKKQPPPETGAKSFQSQHLLSPTSIASSFKSLQHIRDRVRDFIVVDEPPVSREDYARPLYRQDIFYSGSVLNIPQYRSQPDVETYVTSITAIPEVLPLEEEGWFWQNCCCCVSKSTKDVLKMMLDFSLMKNKTFLLLFLGNVFAMIGFYVPFVYLTNRAILLGVEASSATFLISVIGITNTIGRLIAGFLADLPQVNALTLNNIALIISGVVTMLSPLCTTYTLLVIYAAVFGLCISAYISLTSIILCDLLGLEMLTNAFGLLTLARGMSSAVGPPLAGAVYDAAGTYDVSFYNAGALIIVGGLLHCVLHFPYFHANNSSPHQNGDVIVSENIQLDETDKPVAV